MVYVVAISVFKGMRGHRRSPKVKIVAFFGYGTRGIASILQPEWGVVA